MINFQEFAMNLIKNSPNIKNNPMAQNAIEAIQNNDAAKGEEIANNLCETYGISREEAMAKAKEFFLIP